MNRFQRSKDQQKVDDCLRTDNRMNDITRFYQAWIDEHKNDIFRYWVYKKVYTPYEQDKKFVDETIYEDDICTYAKVVEILPMINGDLIIGLRTVEDPNEDSDMYHLIERDKVVTVAYYKFSEIELELYRNLDAESGADEGYDWYDHGSGWDEAQAEGGDDGDGE